MAAQSAFPELAATLPGEAAMLAAVVANPGDDTTKFGYADWLEEHDDDRGPLLRKCVTAFRAGKKLPGTASVSKPWRDLVGITLMGRIVAAKLTDRADSILRLARPAITFKSSRTAEAKLPIGSSKFGGGPDLSPKMKWPTFRDEPLTFLGQFNLADLATSLVCRELPKSGLLSLFSVYDEDEGNDDFDEKGSWRLWYTPDVQELVRQYPPENAFKPCRLTFTETLTVPDRDSPWLKDLGFKNDEEAEERYQETIVSGVNSVGGLGHRILGYPCPLQNDPLGRKTMRHLLTIDSDDKPGWMWGDGGLVYFTISEANLKAHRVNRVRFEMQCD